MLHFSKIVVRASQQEITRLLNGWKEGQAQASALLMEHVWNELHRLAASMMRAERPSHTLQPTALVNEAFLRLAGPSSENWKNRAQFFAIAATMMRRILVDYAKKRRALKRGANGIRVELREAESAATDPIFLEASEVLELDAALERLRAIDARQATIVEMRYFTGMTIPEVAETLQLSEKTINREWKHAKTWLREELTAKKTV